MCEVVCVSSLHCSFSCITVCAWLTVERNSYSACKTFAQVLCTAYVSEFSCWNDNNAFEMLRSICPSYEHVQDFNLLGCHVGFFFYCLLDAWLLTPQDDSDVQSVVSIYCDVSGGQTGYEGGSPHILSPDCHFYLCDGDDDSTDRWVTQLQNNSLKSLSLKSLKIILCWVYINILVCSL